MTNCKICQDNPSKYLCPKCNIPYCSLDCYKSGKHLDCSETFYQDQVCGYLSSRQLLKSENDQSQDIQDILWRNSLLNDEENYLDDGLVETITQRLDSLDLGKISDLTRENVDENELWNLLTPKYKNKFLNSRHLIDEAVDAFQQNQVLVSPWWIDYDTECNIVTEKGESLQSKNRWDLPKRLSLLKPIPLCRVKEDLVYNFIDLIFSYCFTYRTLNGDILGSTTEALAILSEMSISFDSSCRTSFSDTQHILYFMKSKLLNYENNRNFDMNPEIFMFILEQDVAKILNEKDAVIASLSDLHECLQTESEKSRMSFLFMKKCLYFGCLAETLPSESFTLLAASLTIQLKRMRENALDTENSISKNDSSVPKIKVLH